MVAVCARSLGLSLSNSLLLHVPADLEQWSQFVRDPLDFLSNNSLILHVPADLEQWSQFVRGVDALLKRLVSACREAAERHLWLLSVLVCPTDDPVTDGLVCAAWSSGLSFFVSLSLGCRGNSLACFRCTHSCAPPLAAASPPPPLTQRIRP